MLVCGFAAPGGAYLAFGHAAGPALLRSVGTPTPRPAVPRASRGRPAAGDPSAAGDGRDDRDDLTLGDGGIEAAHEADVLVGHEHVDEPAQLALVVKQAALEPGILGVEGGQHLADGRAVDLHFRVTSREGAQLGRDADDRSHRVASFVGAPVTEAAVSLELRSSAALRCSLRVASFVGAPVTEA